MIIKKMIIKNKNYYFDMRTMVSILKIISNFFAKNNIKNYDTLENEGSYWLTRLMILEYSNPFPTF